MNNFLFYTVSLNDLKKEAYTSTEDSVIDTDKLSEEQRLQMCHNATEVVSEMDIEILANTNTEKKKYYVLDMESEEGSSKSPLLRLFVQAFKCPTKPSLYLHVNEEENGNGYVVWVILEEVVPLPNVDFASYSFRLVDNIKLGKSIMYNMYLYDESEG